MRLRERIGRCHEKRIAVDNLPLSKKSLQRSGIRRIAGLHGEADQESRMAKRQDDACDRQYQTIPGRPGIVWY